MANKKKNRFSGQATSDAEIQHISEEAYRSSGIAESNRQQGIQNAGRVQQQREDKKQRSSGVELLQTASSILKNSPTAPQTQGYRMNTGDYATEVINSRSEKQKKNSTSFWDKLLKDRSKDAEKSKMPDMRPIGSVIAGAKPGEAATRAGEIIPSALKSTVSGISNAIGFLLDPSENSGGIPMRDPSGSRKDLGSGRITNSVDEVRGRLSANLYDTANNLSEEAAAHEEAAKDGLGKVGQTLVDVGIAGTQMIGDISAGAMTGTGMMPIGLRVFGQGSRKALDAGASRREAAAYATTSAAVEMLTERMFDVGKLFGGGMADDAIEKLVERWAKSPAGTRALRTFFGVLTEAGEEAAATLVDPIVQLFYNSDAVKQAYGTAEGRRELFSNTLHDAEIGGILGGLGTVVHGNSVAEQRKRLREAAEEAARAEQRAQAEETQRERYAPNTMQTGASDAEAAAILERNRVRANRPQTAQALARVFNGQQITEAEATAILNDTELMAQMLNAVGTPVENGDVRGAFIRMMEQNGTPIVQTAQNAAESPVTRTESQEGNLPSEAETAPAEDAQGQSEAQTRSGSAETHIDNRGADAIRRPSVKAFQYEHPELREHFQKIAQQLQMDAAESVSEGPMAKRTGGTVIKMTKGLRVLMDRTHLSRSKLVSVLQNIIDDHGAENTADAKRVELALDYLMSEHPDYRDEAYREKKGQLDGGTPVGSFEEYLKKNEDYIALGMITEEEVRREWEQMQAERNGARPAPAQPRSDAKVMRDAAGIKTFDDLDAEAEQRTDTSPRRNKSFLISGDELENLGRGKTEAQVNPEDSTGAAPAGFDVTPENAAFEDWSQNSEDLHPMGEGPRARGVDLPTVNPQGQNTMRGGRTVMEARATPEYHAEQIGQLYADGELAYVPVPNQQLAQEATETIERFGWNEALLDWTARVRNGETSPDLVAMGATLLNNAGNAQQVSTEEYLSLVRDYVELTHRTGQALQANRILKRLTPESRLYMLDRSIMDDLDESGLEGEERTDAERRAHEYAEEWSRLQEGDDAALLDLIRRLNAERRTGGLFTPGRTGNTLNRTLESVIQQEGGFDYLLDIAQSQIRGVVTDRAPMSPIEAAKSIRYMSMLSKLTTVMRNLVGNNVFDPIESLSGNVATIPDMLMSLVTHRRTTAGDASWFSAAKRRGSIEGMQRAYIAAALDADVDGGMNRWEQRYGRTFKMVGNPVSRFFSTMEKWQRYALNVTDEFQKGGIEAEAERQRQSLIRRGLLEEGELEGYSEETARQRTFQNAGVVSNLMLGARNLLNGGEDGRLMLRDRRGGTFGVGDALIPFARVPGNVVGQFLNYTPAGLVHGIGEMTNVLIHARSGNITAEQQAQAARDIGRGLNGSALLTAFAALAAHGLLNVSDGGDTDDEKDLAKLRQSEGVTGTQWNLSATQRWLSGGNAEWQDGDNLMSIGFLEPINGIMALAALVADSDELNARTLANSTAAAAMQSIADLPAMNSLTNIINNYKYAEGDTADKIGMAGAQLVGDTISSFVPNALSGIAQGMDDGTVRQTYGSDKKGLAGVAEETMNSIKGKIPGARSTLPAALDNFGQERKTTASPLQNWFNSNLLPGALTKYSTNRLNQEIERMATEGAKVPDRNAEKSFTQDGQKYELNNSQQRKYQKAYGKTARDGVQVLLNSDIYRSMSNAEKSAAMDAVLGFAKQTARESVFSSYEVDSTTAKAREAAEEAEISPIDYLLIASTYMNYDEDGNGSLKQSEVTAALDDTDLDDWQKAALWQLYNSNWSTKNNPYLN